jgi:hypothetical protein
MTQGHDVVAAPAGAVGVTPDGNGVPLRLPDAIVRQPLIEVSHDRALLRMPGAGRMLVTTDDIVTALSPGCSHAQMAPLADPALALQWLLRAVPTLRASSVARGDSGVLLTGTGPVGTSTVAAGLAVRGWRVLGDAVAPVIVADGTIAVVPTTDTIALWPDALVALGLDADLGVQIRPGLRKRAVPAGELLAATASAGETPGGETAAANHAGSDQQRPGSSPSDISGLLADMPVPVDMVVLVRQSNHEPLGAVAYSGFDAVTAVGRASWHHDIALALHDSTAHFAWATALATGTRIIRVTLPRRGDPVAAADLVAGIADGTIAVEPA